MSTFDFDLAEILDAEFDVDAEPPQFDDSSIPERVRIARNAEAAQ